MSNNDCYACIVNPKAYNHTCGKDELFELTMKTGTVFYEKKRLEDILKQVHEIADMALKHQIYLESDLAKVARQRYDALLEIRGLSNV